VREWAEEHSRACQLDLEAEVVAEGIGRVARAAAAGSSKGGERGEDGGGNDSGELESIVYEIFTRGEVFWGPSRGKREVRNLK
jgi:hypothetical protein